MYTKYEPWNSASFYSGEMEFEVGGKDFGLERNFYHREKADHIDRPSGWRTLVGRIWRPADALRWAE